MGSCGFGAWVLIIEIEDRPVERVGLLLRPFGSGLRISQRGFGGGGEEQNVGGDVSVRGEGTFGQADDGVEAELGEKIFLDCGGGAEFGKDAVGHDDSSAGWATGGGRRAA